jgi:hypothetical protein
MSITSLLFTGSVIVLLSMLLAMIVVSIRDARTARIHKEELLSEEDELLPPYEYPPPAYVAELDAEAPLYQLDLDVKDAQNSRIL